MSEKKKTATPAAQWKKAEPELVELPSGNSAFLKRPNMYVLMKTGQIPEVVMRMMDGDENLTLIEKQFAMEWQVAIAFKEPRISVEGVLEGELNIDDIDDKDKNAVMTFLAVEETKAE
jgi:hypothetical protein